MMRTHQDRKALQAALDVVRLAACEPSEMSARAIAAAVAAAPDWAHVLRIAATHGVAPLLADAIHAAPWADDVPAYVRKRLHLHAVATAIANRSAFNTLAILLDALAELDIRPIVMKGPALAQTLYSSPSLRPFGDLDLLCPVDRRGAAHQVLCRFGYELRAPLPGEQENFHGVYLNSQGDPRIELHNDLLQLGLPTRCLADLWRAPETFAVGGTEALMLAPHHQILHLCVHLHTHGYGRLIWFKDLDLLIRQRGHDIDWPQVYALARAEGAELSVRHALAHLRTLLDTPLPAEALPGPRGIRVGEVAHAILWPRRHVLELESKQRIRSVRFNPRRGVLGVVPNLLVMGRRRDKLARLLGGHGAAS